MRVKTFQLGELNANCYLVETAPGRCVAIDIGGSPRILLEYMKMKRLKLTKILLTHGHFDHVEGVKGLFEIRVEEGGNIYRVFCCLDEGNLVILFNAFHKKTQKTPKGEIEKAKRIMKAYFEEKKGI